MANRTQQLCKLIITHITVRLDILKLFALQTVILETEVAHKATKDIMTMHCIPRDRSADLLSEGESDDIQQADVTDAKATNGL